MHGTVVSKTWLTPDLVRIVLRGDGLAGLTMPEATDAYVNIAIKPAGATYDDIFDPAAVRDTHPREEWPSRRRYTVRSWEPATSTLTLDFVVHQPAGVAAEWASQAEAGSILVFQGPSGGYRPDPEADWHLLVGDESALPAIAASLEVLPAGSRAVVRLVCNGPDREIEVTTEADLDLRWLHRTGSDDDAALLPVAVRELSFPDGRVHAFVHGEAEEIRDIRRHLLVDRGLTRQDMSCSPYWRRTMTDESWRAVKRDFVAAMEADG